MSTVTPGERRTTRRSRHAAAVAGIFLVLHPPILEPDLDLFLGQTERGGDLDPAKPGEVHAGGELVLET